MNPVNPTGEVDNPPSLAGALGRLALSLATWGVMVGGVVVVVRLGTSPDAGRTAAMRAARLGERYAMYQARVWAGVADWCNAAYDGARLTSVH